MKASINHQIYPNSGRTQKSPASTMEAGDFMYRIINAFYMKRAAANTSCTAS